MTSANSNNQMKCFICKQMKDLSELRQLGVADAICLDCSFVKKNAEVPKRKVSWNDLITPTNLKTFIGQESIKKELHIMLEAHKKHHIPVQHVLFSGSYGLGKTTLAKIFAGMVDKWEIVTALDIKSAADLPKNPVVVLDEIHTIRDEEWLLGLMDRGSQVILGATTTAGSLSGPLRSRFVTLTLEPYTVPELQIMVKQAATNMKYKCPDYVSLAVAQRGKTVARIALFLFKRIYDRIILNDGKVTAQLLDQWFQEMGIDSDGLDNADRAYLRCLSNIPVGIQYLSVVTGLDKITLEDTVEPYLLTRGYVKRTSRGRIQGDRKPLDVW